MFTISIPVDCLTFIDFGSVPLAAEPTRIPKGVHASIDKPRRRPNHWQWKNKKEYAQFWYKQNRDHAIKRALESYYRNK
tara:strand:- start:20 stop:256 length:237 start_codon:yes stop_codon:yes gene_type:complete